MGQARGNKKVKSKYWVAVIVSVAQLCLTLCDPVDCSPPGSSIHGISQAKILEWVAISFSRGSSRPRDQTQASCIGRQIVYHRATWEALKIRAAYYIHTFSQTANQKLIYVLMLKDFSDVIKVPNQLTNKRKLCSPVLI